MKQLLLAVFLLIAAVAIAQKRYDCVVIPLKGKRTVGLLKAISDSTLLVGEKLFNWKEVRVVRFRKHNGFFRTVVPIFVAVGVPFGVIVEAIGSGFNNSSYNILHAGLLTLYLFGSALIVEGMPIYFLTRNKNFPINTYDDFQSLKLASNKYLIK